MTTSSGMVPKVARLLIAMSLLSQGLGGSFNSAEKSKLGDGPRDIHIHLADQTPVFPRSAGYGTVFYNKMRVSRVREDHDVSTGPQPRYLRRLLNTNHVTDLQRLLLESLKVERNTNPRNIVRGVILPMFELERKSPSTTTRWPAFVPKNNPKFHSLKLDRRKILNFDSEHYLSTSVNHGDRVGVKAESRSVIYDKLHPTNASSEYVDRLRDVDINSDNVTRRSALDNLNNHTKNEIMRRFAKSLDIFEGRFYNATFTKLTQISPEDRRENGVSFVHSALLVSLALLALSLDVEDIIKADIEKSLNFSTTDMERTAIINEVLSSLPASSEALTFRWSSRLVLGGGHEHGPLATAPGEHGAVATGPGEHGAVATGPGEHGAVATGPREHGAVATGPREHGAVATAPGEHVPVATAPGLKVDRLNRTLTAEQLALALNQLIEEDSGGVMRNTFEEDEFSDDFRAALLSVVYFRARWRAAPTLLNGSRPFHDGEAQKTTRMMRINDLMRYADLTEWDAQALEISYSTPGLTLLLLVPRGRSLRAVAARAARTPAAAIAARLRPRRVAATLPLYTLRMTLLLPSKFEAMGISRLVDTNCSAQWPGLRLSHAVQRLMFWSEAGRNAFKDDGIEWDIAPELEIVVNRPYVFFVRWRDLTLMSGNFVL